jgi:hypothetical protein
MKHRSTSPNVTKNPIQSSEITGVRISPGAPSNLEIYYHLRLLRRFRFLRAILDRAQFCARPRES